MSEKRILIAALLSVGFLTLYAKLIPAPARQQQVVEPSPIVAEAPKEQFESKSSYLIAAEDVVTISGESLEVDFGKESGAVKAVRIPGLGGRGEDEHLEFSTGAGLLATVAPDVKWTLANIYSDLVTFVGSSENGGRLELSYRIGASRGTLDVLLSGSGWLAGSPSPKLVATWQRTDGLGSRNNPLEVVAVTKQGDEYKHKSYNGSQRKAKNVPRGTFLLSMAERYFCQSIRYELVPTDITLPPTDDELVAAMATLPGEVLSGNQAHVATVYFGPRDYSYLKQSGFEKSFKIGMFGQIGLILLWFMRWLAGLTGNYGVAIILFSVLVGVAMAPFTLLGFRSMRKMQELKPLTDKIMATQKDNPKKSQAELMALYKQHRVSPMSGCLPMLLQFPILIALFQAISHFVDLRGRDFLWIRDLSMPDRAWTLPFSLPFLGSEINALPLVMAIVMYVQSKVSQRHMPSDQSNPMAKMMSGPLMSVLFGVMFYHFPAGLVLYWLTNSITSIAWYRMAK